MSRVCRKIVSLFGLALVIGITTAAAGIMPMQQASAASNDVNVQFRVFNGSFMAQILEPAEGSVSYSDGAVTAKINYSNVREVCVYLTFPDGHQVLVDTMTPTDDSGEYEAALPVDAYGDYTITVSGTDLSGNAMPGDSRAFSYRAVTAEISEDHGKIKVSYGTNICKLGLQVYKASDGSRESPLLDPEYIIDAEQTGGTPNVAEVEIPGFEELGPEEFKVVVTAYDCLNDDAVDTYTVDILGNLLPPATGAVSILGVTVSQADYLITGLVVFACAAILALFLLGRLKKTNR